MTITTQIGGLRTIIVNIAQLTEDDLNVLDTLDRLFDEIGVIVHQVADDLYLKTDHLAHDAVAQLITRAAINGVLVRYIPTTIN